MTQPAKPPLAGNYWLTMLVFVLGTFPGLITATALGLMAQSMGKQLGVGATEIQLTTLVGDAGLAFGVVIGADLAQRLELRRLNIATLFLFIAGSAVAALAPSLWVLNAGHAAEGIATGMLYITLLPPLMQQFGPERLPTSVTVVILGLFGAATLGPTMGGIAGYTDTWRWFFAAAGLVTLIGVVIAGLVLPERPAPHPDLLLDPPGLVLTLIGLALLVFGLGHLQAGAARWPESYLPVGVGAALLLLLLAVEAREGEPLMPIHRLASSFPVIGAVVAIVASAAYTGMLGPLDLYLERLRGLGPLPAGLLLAPEVVGGVAGALLAGALFRTRWLEALEFVGLAFLAVVAWRFLVIEPGASDLQVLWLAGLLGLGSGLTIAPGLFTASLSVPLPVVGRALAFVELYRLVATFVMPPALRQVSQLSGASGPSLAPGLRESFVIVLAFTLAGLVVVLLVFAISGARLHAPNLDGYLNRQEPAYESPPIGGHRHGRRPAGANASG